jgi:CENP-B N-terminal DNA-binding domain/Tc5 transposase DNA-binding domain
MSEKRKLNKKRKWLTLEEKLDIIRRHEEGESYAKIAYEKKMNESSIRALLKKKKQIKAYGISTACYTTKMTVRQRSSIMNNMERLLMIWIEDCNQKRIPLSQAIIQNKAMRLYKAIKESRDEGSDEKETF